MATVPCNTVDVLGQLIRERSDSLTRLLSDKILANSCVDLHGLEDLLGAHSYAHSVATFSEIGIGLSIVLLTELIKVPPLPDEIRRQETSKALIADLQRRLAATPASALPLTRNFQRQIKAAQLKDAVGVVAVYIHKLRRYVGYTGLSLGFAALICLAFPPAVGRAWLLVFSTLSFLLPSVVLLILKYNTSCLSDGKTPVPVPD